MLALPTPATDPITLADWLELSALTSHDLNSSVGDLERALRSAGVLDASPGAEADEEIDPGALQGVCLDTFSELEARSVASSDAYPFELRPTGSIHVRIPAGAFSPYVFCLCLSYVGDAPLGHQRIFPRRLFEHLSCAAARNYLSGEGVRFASPRDNLPRAFRTALTEVCDRMGEGSTRARAGQPADASLDVVAWRHFADRHPGKLVMFGQCASGRNWSDKLGELHPLAFCGPWLSIQPVSQILRAFFIPHRISGPRWEEVNRLAGLVFDRCRLAYWVARGGLGADPAGYVRWSTAALSAAQLG